MPLPGVPSRRSPAIADAPLCTTRARAFGGYDKDSDRIEYQPSTHDEIALGIPDVVYGRV
ncbi:hypothetical protein NN3_00940 [Nocardia neocaledoniensis NBRC 108232]|nr:hypothetical protein NN3_00940 [Nocardia neocaledoniensis NBRC 108232]